MWSGQVKLKGEGETETELEEEGKIEGGSNIETEMWKIEKAKYNVKGDRWKVKRLPSSIGEGIG